MEILLRAKTLEDFKHIIAHAYACDIRSVANRKLPDEYWKDYKEDTVLLIEDDTISYGASIISDKYIDLETFLKTDYGKKNGEQTSGKQNNRRNYRKHSK
jgi:hypothetical protein